MTPLYDDEALMGRYRGLETELWRGDGPGLIEKAADIADGAEILRFNRVKASHKGIGQHATLRQLSAGSVNQDFLDEICQLTRLKVAFLGYPFTATDISGLSALQNLHTIKIDSPRNITDFSVLMELPRLHTLFIENAKHLKDIEFLRGAHHLKVIGIEGSMWTHQKVESLAPLAGLEKLEALFLTTARLKDKDLTPLAACPNLRVVQCARFAPKAAFDALRAAAPALSCRWCDKYEVD